MKTSSHPGSNADYERIAKAIAFIRDNAGQQPSLEQVASHVGLSPWHFQREFTSWAGVSPKRFLEFLTVQHANFQLFVKGTNFQVNVWRALLRIPEGSLISYKQLAQVTGNPAALRATASAVGANPVSYLIPCHRVLRSSGELGGYHWGLERKKAMIAWDSARAESVGSK